MYKIKLISVPYLARPTTPVKVTIHYASGNKRFGKLTERDEFYCSKGQDKTGNSIVVFWDKRNRMFSVNPDSAKMYFKIVKRPYESLDTLLSKFKHPTINLYK